MPEAAESVEQLEKRNLALKIELERCIQDYRSFGVMHGSLYAQRRVKELEQRLAEIRK
jgi:hypothetical protein